METTIPEYFWADRLTPVNYYGYTSRVEEKVYELDIQKDGYKQIIQRFMDLKQKAMDMYVNMGTDSEPDWTKDVWDNRVVVECITETDDTIFVGWYDGQWSIGKSMYSRDGRTARPYKQD